MSEKFEQYILSDKENSGETEKHHPDAKKRLWEAFKTLTYSGLAYPGPSGQKIFVGRTPEMHRFIEQKRVEEMARQSEYLPKEKRRETVIIKGKEPGNITRAELLELAGLPQDFILEPLPEFPSTEEVQRVVKERTANLKLEQNQQPTKQYFEALKSLPYPRIVCEAILRASKYHGYLGFIPERYEEFLDTSKTQYGIVNEILLRK